jgi:hypothetical protein
MPGDVARIRLRTCTSAGEACTTDPVEVWKDVGEVDLEAGFTQTVPVGLTLFELALTNGDDRVLGSASQVYDVKAGTQTLPSFVIKLDQREMVDANVAVPAAPQASGDVTWDGQVKDLLATGGCTTCHNGRDQTLDNHVRLDLTRYPPKSYTKTNWDLETLVDESVYRVDPATSPDGGTTRMPPAPGARWAQDKVAMLKAWFDAGMPKAQVGDATPAPANIRTLEVDVAEMFGGRVLPQAEKKVLAREDARFYGAVGQLALGAKYQLTFRYYDSEHRLLRAQPEIKQIDVDGPEIEVACSFAGMPTEGTVVIPIEVEP